MNTDEFMERAIGECQRCGHADSWHYPAGTYTLLFGLIEVEHGPGCGNIRCDCEGFEGASMIYDRGDQNE